MRYRLLCASDLHGVMPEQTPSTGTAAWLVAGDVAQNGDGKRFTLWALKQTIPVLGVRGEHESGVFGKLLFRHYCTDISGTAHRFGKGLLVAGVGFCGNFNSDTHHLPTEDAIATVAFAALRAVRRRRRKGDAVVLLTHYPPAIPEWIAMSGQENWWFYHWLKDAIEQLRPVAVVCGHAHGSFGKSIRWKHMNGSTLLFSPGPEPKTLVIDTTRNSAHLA